MFPSNLRRRHQCGPLGRARHTALQRINSFFANTVPWIIEKGAIVFIIVFTALGVCGVVATFITPTLRLPTKAYFAIFKPDHLFEKYRKDIVPNFQYSNPLKQTGAEGIALQFVWGIKPIDNGDWKNPNSTGSLVFYDSYNPSTERSQTWMVDFCNQLKNQSFIYSGMEDIECSYHSYWNIHSGSCIYQPGNVDITPCCNDTTPVDEDMFKYCTPYTSVIHLAQSRNSPAVLGLHMFDDSAVSKAYVIEITSTQPFSPIYSVMGDLYKDVDAFFKKATNSAPPELQNGFFHGLFEFYDLQSYYVIGTITSMSLSMLMACGFILFTTWSLLISTYSILTIFFAISVSIGCLIAKGWELNVNECCIVTLSVGLSIDFTIHYGVAYLLSAAASRKEKVREAFARVGCSVFMAAFTTFIAGAALSPARLVAYRQFSFFLAVVMPISWSYATFLLQSLCLVIGPIKKEDLVNGTTVLTGVEEPKLKGKDGPQDDDISLHSCNTATPLSVGDPIPKEEITKTDHALDIRIRANAPATRGQDRDSVVSELSVMEFMGIVTDSTDF